MEAGGKHFPETGGEVVEMEDVYLFFLQLYDETAERPPIHTPSLSQVDYSAARFLQQAGCLPAAAKTNDQVGELPWRAVPGKGEYGALNPAHLQPPQKMADGQLSLSPFRRL